LSGSTKPECANDCQYHESTAKLGTVIAPSFSDSSRSTSWSTSIELTWPMPSHSGHMPSGRLKLNAVDGPT
jgi:hypothetical protein